MNLFCNGGIKNNNSFSNVFLEIASKIDVLKQLKIAQNYELVLATVMRAWALIPFKFSIDRPWDTSALSQLY